MSSPVSGININTVNIGIAATEQKGRLGSSQITVGASPTIEKTAHLTAKIWAATTSLYNNVIDAFKLLSHNIKLISSTYKKETKEQTELFIKMQSNLANIEVITQKNGFSSINKNTVKEIKTSCNDLVSHANSPELKKQAKAFLVNIGKVEKQLEGAEKFEKQVAALNKTKYPASHAIREDVLNRLHIKLALLFRPISEKVSEDEFSYDNAETVGILVSKEEAEFQKTLDEVRTKLEKYTMNLAQFEAKFESKTNLAQVEGSTKRLDDWIVNLRLNKTLTPFPKSLEEGDFAIIRQDELDAAKEDAIYAANLAQFEKAFGKVGKMEKGTSLKDYISSDDTKEIVAKTTPIREGQAKEEGDFATVSHETENVIKEAIKQHAEAQEALTQGNEIIFRSALVNYIKELYNSAKENGLLVKSLGKWRGERSADNQKLIQLLNKSYAKKEEVLGDEFMNDMHESLKLIGKAITQRGLDCPVPCLDDIKKKIKDAAVRMR